MQNDKVKAGVQFSLFGFLKVTKVFQTNYLPSLVSRQMMPAAADAERYVDMQEKNPLPGVRTCRNICLI